MKEQEEWLQGIRDVIKSHAEAKANRVYLEHFRKSKKSLLMAEALKTDPEAYKAANAQEAYAYRHPEYIELLDGLKKAVEVEEYERWRLRQREWRFEQWRTTQANERAERARYGA